MKQHIFIINPKAGKHKAETYVEYINENYKHPIIKITEYEGHGIELAKEYAKENSIIYAVGGDGTLNEVVNGVMQSSYRKETVVASVPCGSGNDFIREITEKKDVIEILKDYKDGETKLIDLGKVNGRYFMNIASVGFDAEIVWNARKYKKLPLISAGLAYGFSIIEMVLLLKKYPVKYKIGRGESVREDIMFCTFANGKYYGGGMKPAPNAEIDDGLLEIAVVHNVSRRKLFRVLPKYLKGDIDNVAEITVTKEMKAYIQGKQELPLNLDGEVTWGKSYKIEIEKKAVHILLPKK